METEEPTFCAQLSAVASSSVNPNFVSSSVSLMGGYLYWWQIEVVRRWRFDPSLVPGDRYLILSRHLQQQSEKLPILVVVVLHAEAHHCQRATPASQRFVWLGTPFQRQFALREE